MTHQEHEYFEQLILQIAQVPWIQELQRLEPLLLRDDQLMKDIEQYRKSKAEYTQLLQAASSTVQKKAVIADLQKGKQQLDKHPELGQYYQHARALDLYIDDLNFQMNQLLEQKTGCRCRS